MVISDVFIENWCLTIEGEENGKMKKHYIAIPPTNGDRIDIITSDKLKDGYNYSIDGVIIVNVIKGKPLVDFHIKGYKK